MLYLVTLKPGNETPVNCDDSRTLFAVRDILSYEEGSFTWPQAQDVSVQLCVLNLHGFVEKRIIKKLKL